MRATIRAARPSDIKAIGTALRAVDALECRAFGHEPRAAVRACYLGAALKWTAEVGGRPAGMFGVGVGSAMDRTGRPWLLGTPELDEARRSFLEIGRPVIAEMLGRFRFLENWSHQTNSQSHRWLKRLGFRFDEEITMIGGEPFLRFWRDERVR